MDISKLSISDLKALQAQIPEEIERRQSEDKEKVLVALAALAKSHGYALEDIVGASKRTAAKKKNETVKTVPVKYRHPENKELAWTGRGRQPKWVADWVSQGKTLEELKAAA